MESSEQLFTDILSANKRDYQYINDIVNRISYFVEHHHTMDDLDQKLRILCSNFLVGLLNKPPMDCDQELLEELLDRISNLISWFCHRIAVGKLKTQFHFECGTFDIHESSFTESEIGFQTWGAG